MTIHGDLKYPYLCVHLLICLCKNQYASVTSCVHFSSVALSVWVTCMLKPYTQGFFFSSERSLKKS